MVDIDFIIGYSTMKSKRLSDPYWFYYHLREIEKQKINDLLLYIKCVSVFLEHAVSVHGAATAINREYLGIFLFLFVYNNLCILVHE